MNVSIASRALTDPEIKRLAKVVCDRRPELAVLPATVKHRYVLGVLLFVWEACYTRRSEYVDAETVDAIAEIDGFLDAMVECELAELPGDEVGEGLWRICGVADRIRWLDKQEAKGRSGGMSTAKRRRRDNELARAAAVALAQVQPDGQPLSNPEIPDLRDLIQKGCGQVDAVLARLSAVRSRLAIALRAEVPRIRPGERIDLLDTLDETAADPDAIDRAFVQLEQLARAERRVAGVDDLCQLLRRGRAAPMRAELRVVRDGQVAAEAES